jgi:hypothetical protein
VASWRSQAAHPLVDTAPHEHRSHRRSTTRGGISRSTRQTEWPRLRGNDRRRPGRRHRVEPSPEAYPTRNARCVAGGGTLLPRAVRVWHTVHPHPLFLVRASRPCAAGLCSKGCRSMVVSSAGMPAAATEAAIAVALYASPLSRAAWRRMGPAGVAAYTAGLLAATGSGLPALVAVVLAAERAGTLADPARWRAARRAACRVAAGPARPAAQPARSAGKRAGSARRGRA